MYIHLIKISDFGFSILTQIICLFYYFEISNILQNKEMEKGIFWFVEIVGDKDQTV